jgi:hypothetical protein
MLSPFKEREIVEKEEKGNRREIKSTEYKR